MSSKTVNGKGTKRARGCIVGKVARGRRRGAPGKVLACVLAAALVAGALAAASAAVADGPSHVSYFLEITLSLCPSAQFSLALLERSMRVVKAMRARGYEITCDEGAVTCSIAVAADAVQKEYDELRRAVEPSGG